MALPRAAPRLPEWPTMNLLSLENVGKGFPGVRAVQDVTLGIAPGEVLALVGENGAGKSTLSQIIAGVYRPDSGRMELEGREVSFGSPLDALRAGIAIVFQELSLVGGLSIAENIFINRQPVDAWNRVRWAELYAQTAALLRRFDVGLDPRTLVKRLSKGQQQIVEIVKALSTNPKLLILDEPTSSLTETETRYVFEATRRLRSQGLSVLYISHKLSEVFALTDRVAVMRDGRLVGAVATRDTDERQLISMMVGREIGDVYGARQGPAPGEPVLEVRNLSRRGVFSGVSFTARRGEILGLSGLVGSGRTEVARAVAGFDPRDAGEVLLEGVPLPSGAPRDAIRAGPGLRHRGPEGPGALPGHAGAGQRGRPFAGRLHLAAGAPAARPHRRLRGRGGEDLRHPDPVGAEEGGAAVGRQPAEVPHRLLDEHGTRRWSSSTSRPAAWTWAPGRTSTARSASTWRRGGRRS